MRLLIGIFLLPPEATLARLNLQIFKDICDQGVVRVMMDWKFSRLISVQFRVKEE